ncbi:transcriptional coactivator p15/PC4 family protein [bacterium]|nr:transcriptional coactivator p15/PC4 family protein [bacterium]MBU1634535.1 transcriptional coactivator p15/PC4 family protein [bacterium]MBU1875318.1 transcriptional coactivator p15/PC4 family protein [bacterium]
MTENKKSVDIHKSDDIIIRISKQEYQDRKFIDVRQYYKDSNSEFQPTKKGVTFPPELLQDVITALKEIEVK